MMKSSVMRLGFQECEKIVDAGREGVDLGMWQLCRLMTNREVKLPQNIGERKVQEIPQISVQPKKVGQRRSKTLNLSGHTNKQKS